MDRYRYTYFFTLVVWMMGSSVAYSQTGTFLYLQSENNLPYQVQWNGNAFPSTAGGYVVIAQVPQGRQTLKVSFSPELSVPYLFDVMVKDRPRGFSIRQGIDNSWSLFEMIDLSVVRGRPVPAAPVLVKEPEELIPLPKEETVKTPVPEKADAKSLLSGPNASAQGKRPVPRQRPAVLSVQRIFDRTGAEGVDQVYVITRETRSDTIALFIPVLKDPDPRPVAMRKPVKALYSFVAR